MIQKGKLTWEGAVAASLCLGQGENSNMTPMQAAIAAAEEKGRLKVGASQPVPQFDEDQEPPAAPSPPAFPPPPPGFYYDANWQLVAVPKVQMPRVDSSPQGYAKYDPTAPAAADAPYTPAPRPAQPVGEAHDPVDDIEEELYADDETPEQKARRKAIERRHKREQEARYIEENGIQPPKGGNVVVVPAGKSNIEKNGEIETGYGAGPADGLKIPPGIYLQSHDAPAQQTLDGEPLLPGWRLAPDGRNLINPNGQLVDTTPRQPGQATPIPQAITLPTTNAMPQGAVLLTMPPAVNPNAGLILPPSTVTPPWEAKQ
jgi:hypothetical protein